MARGVAVALAQGRESVAGVPRRAYSGGLSMPGRVYKIIEVVGSSKVSIEQAVSNAIETCSESIDFLDWFEVRETRGAIAEGKVDNYQVVLRVGFRLDRGD